MEMAQRWGRGLSGREVGRARFRRRLCPVTSMSLFPSLTPSYANRSRLLGNRYERSAPSSVPVVYPLAFPFV